MTPQEMQILLPHQQRVVAEKQELDGKISALNGFLITHTFRQISAEEQTLLHQQLICMARYSGILAARIDLFLKAKP